MKKFTILFFSILIISSNIFAQQKINYGLKFGLVSSEFSFEKQENAQLFFEPFKENRKGPALGFFTDFTLNDAIDFEFDLLYLQKGAEDEIELTTPEHPEGTGETVSYDYQLDYFQINASINPKINFKQVEIQGKLGLSLAILVETKGGILFKDANDFSTGYLFGGKIIFTDILNRPFFIEIIRNIDFSSFYKNDFYELTNNVWMFNLGFYYN